MGEHSLHRKNRAEGKRNRGLGKTWPCHRGWIAGPPLTGLSKIPGCCEPQILRPSWPWQMGSLPFTSGLPACTAILVGGTTRPTRPPPPAPDAGHRRTPSPDFLSSPVGLRVHGCLCRPGGARTVPPLFFLLCSLSHLVLTHTSGQHSGLIISKPF